MSIALEIFCITVAVKIPLATELSVLIGVDGWVKPSSWSLMRRGIAVCPFWSIPPNPASAADATTCLRILHSVWIGPFAGGERFEAYYGLVGSDLMQ